MSRLFDIHALGVKVYIRSRDHCPPHVHLTHEGEGWEARLSFSFLDATIHLLDVMPLARAPRLTVLNTMASAVVEALPACRSVWWRIHGKTCLDGQWLRIGKDNACLPASRADAGALQVRRSSYDTDQTLVTVLFKGQAEPLTWRLS